MLVSQFCPTADKNINWDLWKLFLGNGSSLGHSIYIHSTTREVDNKRLFPKVDFSVPFHFCPALDGTTLGPAFTNQRK